MEVKKQFMANGYNYELVESSWPVAIYHQFKEGVSTPLFEVHLLRVGRPWSVPNGPVFPAAPVHPSNKEWGYYGWTYNSLEAARGRVEKLRAEGRIPV